MTVLRVTAACTSVVTVSEVTVSDLGKVGRKALKKAKRKLRKACKANSLHEIEIAIGMARVALKKAHRAQYGN